MKKNMSKADGILRLIVAVAIIALWYMGLIGEVKQVFVRELGADGAQHGEPADAGVEDADGGLGRGRLHVGNYTAR